MIRIISIKVYTTNMNHLSYGYDDDAPIAALATVLGESALAIIRTSGKNTIELLSSVFSRPKKLQEVQGNTLVHGWILEIADSGDKRTSGKRIDEVLVSVYRAPRSYTGEDAADISCHGGIATVRAIMRVLHGAGFRDALPGEFTFRAFIKGKLDLTKAESVMELVSAKTDQGRDHAVSRLTGRLEQEIQDIKNLLVQVLAGIELFLDYSEDELPKIALEREAINDEAVGSLPNHSLVEEALARLHALAASYRMERLYHDGVLVVIAGQPNAGKSSLFNLLLKEERSIVTDIPGTTRDWIEGWIALEGIPLRLVDTAGLRTSEDRVERVGVERSRELLKAADLVLYLIDGTQGITSEDRAFFQDYVHREDQNRILVLWNKLDQVSLPTGVSAEIPRKFTLLGISAKTGDGISGLASAIVAELTKSSKGLEVIGRGRASPGIATERQRTLIALVIESLEEFLALSEQGQVLDVISPLLREGVHALGEITGEVSTADILEVMFSKFCVGK